MKIKLFCFLSLATIAIINTNPLRGGYIDALATPQVY